MGRILINVLTCATSYFTLYCTSKWSLSAKASSKVHHHFQFSNPHSIDIPGSIPQTPYSLYTKVEKPYHRDEIFNFF